MPLFPPESGIKFHRKISCDYYFREIDIFRKNGWRSRKERNFLLAHVIAAFKFFEDLRD